uniref:Cullin 3 n=1 Tax=Echinococcus granulosus TaxID=6210 RepID=A0A068WL02_ECHGR|nr:cullin 3 [Echinococcus granulosus]
MRIKSFPVSLNEQHISQTWEKLRAAILEIQKMNNTGLSFEELYRNAYTLVLQKHGDLLYNGTKQVVMQHMLRIRESVVENLNNKFLSFLNSCWKDHQTAMPMIRDILLYMDRIYVIQKKVDNVYKMGMVMFCQFVVRYGVIKEHLQKTLLDMVKRERQGELISRPQIRDACQMLVQLGVGSLDVYQEDFEQPFLRQTRDFYVAESDAFLAQNPSAILYITKVEQRIEEEIARVHHYLDVSTGPKLVKVLEQELISRHINTIVNMENSGLTYLLANERYDDIKTMYKVLSRVPEGPKVMSQCISAFVRERGQNIVRDTGSSNPLQYIQDLLQLRSRCDDILIALDRQAIFRSQLNGDFEFFINRNPKSAEFLSLFIDEKLRRGFKGMSDHDVDVIFDQCTVLFRYLQEKDIFERYYKQHLAKRLLLGKCQSDDQEKSMIAKLMAECGGLFTSKLEGMFKDMTVSKSLMEEFILTTANSPLNLDLYVRVLTIGLWPTQTTSPRVSLPADAVDAFSVYSNFYLSKHTGRKISLHSNLGHAELLAVFNGPVIANEETPSQLEVVASPLPSSSLRFSASSSSSGAVSGLPGSPGVPDPVDNPGTVVTGRTSSNRKYVLQVSTFQMVILMLFNQRSRYTFGELLAESGIPERDLMRNLTALCLSKSTQRILCKEPKSKEIEPTDVFSVNNSFFSRHYKIKVQNMSVRESEPERQETRTRVDENRRYVIEATIVRVMKMRKTMEHNQLLAEVMEHLKSRFRPTPLAIKQRIEALIDREFIARSETDRKFPLFGFSLSFLSVAPIASHIVTLSTSTVYIFSATTADDAATTATSKPLL